MGACVALVPRTRTRNGVSDQPSRTQCRPARILWGRWFCRRQNIPAKPKGRYAHMRATCSCSRRISPPTLGVAPSCSESTPFLAFKIVALRRGACRCWCHLWWIHLRTHHCSLAGGRENDGSPALRSLTRLQAPPSRVSILFSVLPITCRLSVCSRA
jgi:hypothetical protein